MARERKPIGAVGHGPAGLLGVRVDGKLLVVARRVTGLTVAEDGRAGWTPHISYSRERRLEAEGVQFEAAGTYRNHVVRGGQLVTGQNPASADSSTKAGG